METVSSTDLQRNLSHYRTQAKSHPVIIEERGKPSVAMIPYNLYMQLTLRAPKDVDPNSPSSVKLEYDTLSRSVLRSLGRDGELNADWLHPAYSRAERLFCLTPIDENSFEIGAYTFHLDAGKVVNISTSPWILEDDGGMEQFRHKWSATLTTRMAMAGTLGVAEHAWEGRPSKNMLQAFYFIPALVGLTGKADQTCEWLVLRTTGTVFWDSDSEHNAVSKGLKKACEAVLSRNKSMLKIHYPDLDHAAFLELFSQ